MLAPAAFATGAAGAMAFGFGAGYGARSYSASTAYKELLEKFPDKPTPEAEALARSGAMRAFVAGTALAGAMGFGVVMLARSYGVHSTADFAEEVKKWLPTKEKLEDSAAKLEPLQRSVSASLQTARDSAAKAFGQSEIGRGLIEKAEKSTSERPPPEKWEKDLVAKIEGTAAADRK